MPLTIASLAKPTTTTAMNVVSFAYERINVKTEFFEEVII